jgi:predicted thioesterase
MFSLMSATPPLGASATRSLTVSESDTAPHHRSGDVPVLATPRLIALCEEATVAAVAPHLPDDHTTVGARIEFDHLAPSAVGSEIHAKAGLTTIDGRMLTFAVTVAHAGKEIARGTVIRAVVDRTRFLERLS